MTIEEAKLALEADKKERVEKCLEKIKDALKEFNCDLVTDNVVIVNGQQIQITLIAK